MTERSLQNKSFNILRFKQFKGELNYLTYLMNGNIRNIFFTAHFKKIIREQAYSLICKASNRNCKNAQFAIGIFQAVLTVLAMYPLILHL